MRKSGPRGSRAKRRQQPRAEPPKPPEAWPDVEVLADALDVNELAARFLEQMRPETVRTILKRMETPTRKAVFERHNIPVTKVGLRSANQVLALLRSDDTPAQSPILGTMLNPASDLFHHSVIGPSETTGLRLKLVDLALSLLITNDAIVNGLRTWHRWAQSEFEDLTLAVVIGLKCSHAVVAAAYLAGSHADVAEKYEALRTEYPRMPEPLQGTLTATNPLSRYLAARPDRKTPADPAELRTMLAEDSRVWRAEAGLAQRERDRRRGRSRAEDANEDDIAYDDTMVESDTADEPTDGGREPESQPPEAPRLREVEPVEPTGPDGPALPGVTDWAAAVSAAKLMTQRLVAGEPPTPQDLEPLQLIHDQVTQMSSLLTHVVGEPVEPSRSGIDATLTLILSDPALSSRFNGIPELRSEVAERLKHIRAQSRSDDDTGEPRRNSSPPRREVTPHPAEDEHTEQDVDLSDLDGMLRSEVGSRLTALAGADDETGSVAPEPDAGGTTGVPATASTTVTEERPSASARELITVGMLIRMPHGELAERFQQLAAMLANEASSIDLLALRCASMPVSLIDPAAGGVPYLGEQVEQLSGCPTVAAFRDSIAELCRQGIQPYDPAMVRMAALSADLEQTTHSAMELLEAAETRTLKYDKATKVYRHWLSPGGTLRPLIDALRMPAPIATITELAEECRKLGASRAVDATAAVLIDANRTKIVAGARKTLTDKFAEVLGLADTATGIVSSIEGMSRTDRSVTWRFDTLTRFRQRAHADMPAIEAELSQLDGVPNAIKALLLRALALAISPDPLYGPEVSQDACLRQTGDRR